MKLKETLNLGKTAFPMRAGLPTKEPVWQKEWEDAKLYQRRQELNEGKPHFTLHDGPPYANGNIHVGHAMNKISKDIIVRSKSMSGFYAPYIPGWDTHGLPIEQVLAKQGVKRKEMDLVEYLKLCREYALSQVDKQREDFKRLGVSGDWDHPYVTLTPDYEAAQIRVFGEMANKGYIYRGAKPVYWSWSSESALAEAEIEYHDLVSTSLYYANKVKDGKGILDTDTYIVVWTTTPFTVTASRGLTVGAEFDYVVVKPAGSDRKYVVASELLPSLSEKFGWENVEVLATYQGKELNHIVTEHPWDPEVDELVILGEHVTLDSGTGIVHTAPGFGEDDYNVGIANGLEVAVTVNERGIMMENAGPDFAGQFYDKVVPTVIEKLGDLLLAQEEISHSYPFDWRTKKPIIWRAVPQWFASVSKFRQEILDEIEKVKFHSEWGKVRLYNMIRDRGDWVISRQRAWGVPLPIFYAEDGTPIMTAETIEHVAQLFEEHGSIVWWERDAKDLLPEGFTHPGSPNGEFKKETDIMDVWFDSGSSWSGVLEVNGLDVPCAMYLEGSDQHRGWFNSSLLTAVATTGKAPYNSVLTHGFVVDGEGRKMSKSVGNTVAPSDIIDVYGADVMRLWVSSADYQADVRLSKDIVKQLSEVYRKIRNTFRFLLGNLDDFNPNTDKVAYADMSEFDKWALLRLEEVRQKVTDAYENYEFHMLYHAIHNFCTVDLSSIYLDVMKDTMYAESKNNVARRSAQTAMYEILKTLVAMVSPVLSFTAEEVWKYMPKEEGMPESVMLQDWPQGHPEHFNQELADKWNQLLDLRTSVQKALELARQDKTIGHPLDASVTVYAEGAAFDALNALGEEGLAKLVIVSEAHIVNGAAPAEAVKDEETGVATVVVASNLEKCERCWIHRDTVGQDSEHPTLCDRCADVVKTL